MSVDGGCGGGVLGERKRAEGGRYEPHRIGRWHLCAPPKLGIPITLIGRATIYYG